MDEIKYVDVDVDLPEEIIIKLFWMAHRQNITLNQLVNNILKEQLSEYKE